MKKLTFVLVLLLTVAVAMPAQANFPDVPEDHWAAEAVATLQAAGIVEGYPDGEFKGSQNMTRYEYALIVARMLDDLNAQLDAMDYDIDALYAEVDELSEGLTAAQADDVAAIVQAMLEEYVPEREEGLTAEQSEQVVNLIRALTAEFNTELRMLRDDLGAMEAFAQMTEDNQERIADLEDRMDAVETVQFSGSYSVNFRHAQTFGPDGEAYGFGTDLNHYYLPDVDGDVLELVVVTAGYAADMEEGITFKYDGVADNYEVTIGEEEPLTFDSPRDAWYYFTAEAIQLIMVDLYEDQDSFDSFDDHLAAAVEQFNEEVAPTRSLRIQEDTSPNYGLPGWERANEFTGFADTTGFSQLLELQLDISTDFFDATVDLDIAGSDDEVSLEAAGLEIENDFVKGIYGMSNTVSINNLLIASEDINGVSVEFKEWDVNTFFGKLTETTGADESDQFISDYDEADEFDNDYANAPFDVTGTGESDYLGLFTQGLDTLDTEDFYLMGASTNISLLDFDIRAGAAMRSDLYNFTHADNRASFTLGTGAVIDNLTLDVDAAFSMEPFADDFNLGTAIVAGATLSLEDLADFDAEIRWKDANFQDLYGAAAHFNYGAAARFDTGIPVDGFALNLGIEQQFVDFLIADADFAMYDQDMRIRGNVGVEDLLVDGLSLVGSFQTIMPEGEIMENTFGVNGSFAATENLTLNAGFEYVQNLDHNDPADYGFADNFDRQTFDIGADFVDFEVIENLTLDAGASFTMVMGNGLYTVDAVNNDYVTVEEDAGIDDLEMNTIEAYVDLEYELGRATFGNAFAFTNKTGAALAREGNLFDNTFSLDYELVQDVEFTSSWQERLMRFSEDTDSNWSTREIKAGVSIDF